MISESTERNIKSIVQIIFLVLVVAISLKFFDAKFLDPKPVKYMAFLCTWAMIGLSLVQIVKQKGEFTFPVRLIFFSIAFSIFMAYYSWDQSLFEGLIETTDFMLWPLFFFLLYLKTPIKTLEKIIVAFGLLYALLYFYQYANSGTVIFGKPIWGEEFLESRGTVRIVFPGAGIFLLTIFISITKITTTKENKWFWIGVAALGLIIPVMQVTRQFIAGVYLLYLLHFSKGTSFFKKMMVSLVFIGGFILLLQSDLPMIQGLLEVGQRDAELGSNYIRVLAGEYFIEDFSPNTLSYIFGNGAPNWGISDYGRYVERLAEEREFFLSDVGIIAVYAMFGIFAILGFLLIWYKSFTVKVPEKYAYVRYYLWYILFTSVTWYSVYHYHYLVATIFAIYIYQKSMDEQKFEILAKKLLKKIQQKQEKALIETKS